MAKVLLNYLGENGSGPVFSLEMSRGIAQNGHEVYAVVSSRNLNLAQWERADFFQKLVIVDTYSSKKDYLLHYNKYTKQVGKTVQEQIGELVFDCVVRTFPHPMLDAVERKLRIRKNVTICHDPVPHSGEALSARIRNRNYMKKAEYVLVLTRAFTTLVAERYHIPIDRVYYMPHGLMGQYKEKQKKQMEEIYNPGKTNYLFFGRIEEYKGIGVLLEAYAMLEQKYEDVTLTIAGKGNLEPYGDKMENLRNLTVRNTYISEEEVGQFFDSESVVCVIPYVDATQSGVIPIALEFGNPIVTTSTGGLPEQLDQGRVGVFAKAGDAKDLFEKMESLRDPRIAADQRRKNLAFARELTWQRVTLVMNSILEV